ncbi:hypothetical protein HZB88_03970 [archaeon]|nr:hypothetical protein [archaeon]
MHEIDIDLFKMKAQNCRAIPGNILSINFPNANKIFGNIPYSVSEPLLERLFKEHFDEAYFLVSNSFFEIISGIKNSRFGIVCPLFFNVKRLFDVKRELFEPVPRVDSVFLRLKKRKDLKKWGAVTKEFYLQKDKHIKNALNTALFRICAWTKKEVKEKLAKYNLTNKRVYMLNSKEFLELVKVVKDLVGNSD